MRSEFFGARLEGTNVLGQASTAESEACVEESTPDPLVVTDRVGERRDVRTDDLAEFTDRIDE